MRYWVSFADQSGNRGVVITRAESPEAAVARIKSLGKSPGGEALVLPLPGNEEAEWPEDTLIAPAQLEAAGYSCKDRDIDENKLLAANPTLICPEHT